MCEGSFGDNLIDTRGEDKAEVLDTQLETRPCMQKGSFSTSGCPFGSKNALGITECLGDSEGGLGFAVYSVKARPVWFGVRGEETPLDLLCPFSGVVGRE